MKLHYIIFLIFLFPIVVPELRAQATDTTGTISGLRGAPPVYRFDTRTTALGSATVADGAAVSSVNINPALLSFVRDLQTVQLNTFQNWENNRLLTQMTLPAYRAGQHRVAMQMAYHTRGPDATNLLGAPLRPQPDFDLVQFDLAYSWSLDNVLSVGVMQTVSFAHNADARYWTGHTSLGVIYAPSESISYGMVFRGLGRSTTWEMIEDGRTTLGSQALNETLELGATLKFPVETDQTYLAISLSNEKRFTEPGIWYKGGLELKAASWLFLRSGILFNPETNTYEPRYGIGLEFNRFIFDYTLSRREHELDRFHQVGLTIRL